MSQQHTSTIPDDWPQCPGCHAPRSTRCLVCGTAGTDFQPADMGFTLMTGPDDAAAAYPSCGPGGCTPGDAPPDDGPDMIDREDQGSPVVLLMCPTCDEPFTPEYPRVCEWCGHQFENGFEMGMPTDPVEQLEPRVVVVIAALLALMLVLAVYFMFVL